jgi:hypothetical protein
MNRERYIELERTGQGLTEEEWEQGWHWCNEWDGMLVGPNTDEALVCSCSHPAIEAWKESEEGKKLQINKNPEKYYTDEILAAIDAAAKKEFCYGSDEKPSEESINENE